MKRFFEFAGHTSILITTFSTTAILLFVVFPNLPINGEMLDVKQGYTFNEALELMDSYGREGRIVYAICSATLDTVLPIVYVMLFAGSTHRFRSFDSAWIVAYIPVVTGFIDLMENVQIISMLLTFPDITYSEVTWASAFTKMKHFMWSLSAVLAITFALIAMIRLLAAKVRKQEP